MERIRILDISSYLRIPPISGGAKRILLPYMLMTGEEGIDVCLLFHSQSDEFTRKASEYLRDSPAILRVEGVTSTYDMNESICKPESICEDVWSVIDRPLLDKALEMVGEVQYDIIQIEHSQMAWMVPLLKQASPKSRIVLDLHNVEYLLFQRWFPYETDNYEQRQRIERKYWQMRHWEEKTWPWFDAAISVSPVESEVFRKATDGTDVWDVATGGGVDVMSYRPQDTVPKDIDMLYLGTMEWYPNAHGMKWFIRKVLPLILEKNPNATLYIAGFGRPDGELQNIAEQEPHIHFLGEVEDDAELFNRTKVFIVPLFIGAGARVKIPTAWACGLPIVSTTIGAEGLRYTEGKDIFICDQEQGFADTIVNLLEDPALRKTVGENARRLAETVYSAQTCVCQVSEIYYKLAGRWPGSAR